MRVKQATDLVAFSLCYRAESEMDIIIPAEVETAPVKSAKPHTPIKAPTPNPLKVLSLRDC